jgi:hypothetical protein
MLEEISARLDVAIAAPEPPIKAKPAARSDDTGLLQ